MSEPAEMKEEREGNIPTKERSTDMSFGPGAVLALRNPSTYHQPPWLLVGTERRATTAHSNLSPKVSECFIEVY